MTNNTNGQESKYIANLDSMMGIAVGQVGQTVTRVFRENGKDVMAVVMEAQHGHFRTGLDYDAKLYPRGNYPTNILKIGCSLREESDLSGLATKLDEIVASSAPEKILIEQTSPSTNQYFIYLPSSTPQRSFQQA